MGLKWPRFVVAVDSAAQVIGCGQVKTHQDGSREMASLVVHPGWRGQGVGGAIIQELVGLHPGELYLMCRGTMGPYYQRFGFVEVDGSHLPHYFQRIKRLSWGFERFLGNKDGLLVMRRS